MPHDIIYPQGCRPISEDLGADELIRRLKTLAHTLQAMGQDEGMYQQYIPLAIHLAEEHFLSHQSRDVQLLIACCIADVLRVYAPEAPYKDQDKVKMIFMFLIKQLGGLKDPKDPAFKRYFYLLENLAYVKSFNMCFDLEDCQEIFCNLFSLMFKIVNDEHSVKVKSFMLDVLCPLITESDIVYNELLDIILMNIVEPFKSQRKNAYILAKELIVKCSDTLEPYIQGFFNHVLIMGKEEKSLTISNKVFDLIYELNKICPSVLLAVLPQLEVKLKSSSEDERLGAVSLLAKMFSEKESNLAKTHTLLWRAFLGRFNDINLFIRIKCVQYSMHFLLNHPDLRSDIIETLQMRQHDTEESVRFEVVMAIVSTAKKNVEVVSGSDELLELVKERTLDKKFKIRKEAMNGLAMIYRKYLMDADVPQATKKAVTWIKDKILHGYYVSNMDDRLVVERLLNNSLVPYTLSTEERMKKLYHLLGTIDDHATKAFLELQKHQLLVRRAVGEWVDLYKKPPSPERDKEMNIKMGQIAKFLPDQVKGQEFLNRLSKHMQQDNSLLLGMQTVVRPDISCKDCAETTSLILKKLGQPVMTNLYYNTIKILLERVSSVMVDSQGIKVLIRYVEDCLKGGNLIEEIGLHPNTAGERGLKLLVMLAYVFPCHFLHAEIIAHLISLVKSYDADSVSPLCLSILTFLGKYKPISELFPKECEELVSICMSFATEGTPKQSKQAIRCLYRNMGSQNDKLFSQILEKVKENLCVDSPHYLTSIVALGHIAYNLPEKFPVHIKNLVSRKIVKELLVKSPTSDGLNSDSLFSGNWCVEQDLPDETRAKIEGCKTMARWLLGLKADKLAAQKTFRMLTAFIQNRGDLLQCGKISPIEMAWMRLAAGKAMLKICEQKGVGDQFTAEQFYVLSSLINDEVPQVRDMFLAKLHKGLNRGLPNKSLPLDFMGYYALTGLEDDKKLKNNAKRYYQNDIAKRREYAKTLTQGSICTIDKVMNELPHILPDYTIVFAIPVLAHCSQFTDHTDSAQLLIMKSCLMFILEPLVSKNEFFSYPFYKELLDRIKNHKDSLTPDDQNVNYRMYALCDLATTILVQKTTNFELKDFPGEPRIPSMYFKRNEDPNYINTQLYIPVEFQGVFNMKDAKVKKKVNNITTTNNNGTTTAARKKLNKKDKNEPNDIEQSQDVVNVPIDAMPASASDTKIRLPGVEENNENTSDGETSEPQPKRTRLQAKTESH